MKILFLCRYIEIISKSILQVIIQTSNGSPVHFQTVVHTGPMVLGGNQLSTSLVHTGVTTNVVHSGMSTNSLNSLVHAGHLDAVQLVSRPAGYKKNL